MKEYVSLRAVHMKSKLAKNMSKISFVAFSRKVQKHLEDKDLGIIIINSGTTKRYAVPVESVDTLIKKIIK